MIWNWLRKKKIKYNRENETDNSEQHANNQEGDNKN